MKLGILPRYLRLYGLEAGERALADIGKRLIGRI